MTRFWLVLSGVLCRLLGGLSFAFGRFIPRPEEPRLACLSTQARRLESSQMPYRPARDSADRQPHLSSPGFAGTTRRSVTLRAHLRLTGDRRAISIPWVDLLSKLLPARRCIRAEAVRAMMLV